MAVVEVTSFRLRPDAAADAFAALDKRLQTEVVYQQPGILRRTAARRGDEWLVVTLWASEDAAAAADAATSGHELRRAFEAQADAASVHTARCDTFE